MVRLTFFYLFILFFSFKLLSEEMNEHEKIFFNFIDLNNDNNLSLKEINSSIKLLFQIIDENRDGKLSELEIIELKRIIESLS